MPDGTVVKRGCCVELCVSVRVYVLPLTRRIRVCVTRARAPPTGAPCAIAGMFGCAPAASDEEYNRFDGMHPDEGHAWLVAHPFY